MEKADRFQSQPSADYDFLQVLTHHALTSLELVVVVEVVLSGK